MKALLDAMRPQPLFNGVTPAHAGTIGLQESYSVDSGRPLSRKLDRFACLVCLGAAAYLYLNLFVLPNTPILLGDDQVFFWTNAQRMLYGERAYLDFFQYTPPGTDLFFLLLFKLIGTRIWVLNTVVLTLGVASCLLCFQIAGQIMELPLALLATVVYLVLIFSKSLNATHHWFSVLMVMCASLVVLPKRTTGRVAMAGGFLGLAAFFTHTHGVSAATALAIFLIREQYCAQRPLRSIFLPPLILSATFTGVLLGLNAYFIASVGLSQMWYQQVTYVHRYGLRSFENLGLPAPLSWRSLPAVGQQTFVYALLPITYVLALLRFWTGSRDAKTNEDSRSILLSLVGLFLVAEVALSPNWLRIYAVSMPGIILAIWILGRTKSLRRYGIPLIWVGIALLGVVQTSKRHVQPYVVAELPAGRAAVSASKWEEIQWIVQHTKLGEFFFQADWPGIYVPLGLRNPVFLDTVGPTEQTRPEYVDLTIRQLEERRVRYVLWSKRLDNADVIRPSEYHLEPLKSYISSRYRWVETFADQEQVWERK